MVRDVQMVYSDVFKTSSFFLPFVLSVSGTWCRMWSSRKVASSIPDCVIGIYHCMKPPAIL